jgi:hypothetical protein
VACYLKAWGAQFDVDAFVAASPLPCDPVWHRGDRRRAIRNGKSALHDSSGLTTLVLAAEGLDGQVDDAVRFLRSYQAEVQRLVSIPEVERVILDFGVAWHPDSAAQFARLPPELLALAGNSNVWLELSHYVVAPEGMAQGSPVQASPNRGAAEQGDEADEAEPAWSFEA